MREIIYRGQRIDNKEWVYGYYAFNPKKGTHYILTWVGHSVMCYEQGCFTADHNEVIPETVGEYSGLKDCNGITKLFEGDIVKADLDWPPGGKGCRDGVIGEVIFYRGMFCFTTIPFIENISHRELHDCYNHKVIGNLWENPELLEAVK